MELLQCAVSLPSLRRTPLPSPLPPLFIPCQAPHLPSAPRSTPSRAPDPAPSCVGPSPVPPASDPPPICAGPPPSLAPDPHPFPLFFRIQPFGPPPDFFWVWASTPPKQKPIHVVPFYFASAWVLATSTWSLTFIRQFARNDTSYPPVHLTCLGKRSNVSQVGKNARVVKKGWVRKKV